MSFKCPNCGGTYFSSHLRGGGVAGTGRCDDQFQVNCGFKWERSDNSAEQQVFCSQLSFDDSHNPAVMTPYPIIQGWSVDYTVFKPGCGIAVISGELKNIPAFNNIPLFLASSNFSNPSIISKTGQVSITINNVVFELGIPAKQGIPKKQQLEEMFEKLRVNTEIQ